MDASICVPWRCPVLIPYTGIKYEDLAYTTANGFAAMGTNNGHNGTTGVTFLGNPDILEDFS